MQLLTEQQIAFREEIFFNLVEEITNEVYEIQEGYEITDEDLYITSILLDYFIDNYRNASITEAVAHTVNETDVNDELYQEIYNIILDESVGKFIAGAVYGIKDKLAALRQKRAGAKADKSGEALRKAKAAAKTAAKAKPTGVMGAVKSSYHKAKVDKMSAKDQAAREKFGKRVSTAMKVSAKRQGLASRIDTGISNIKKKVKSAVTTGASRVGAAIGRMAA